MAKDTQSELAAIAAAQDLLRPHLHDADVYWQTLVWLFVDIAEGASDTHRQDCTTDDCYSCRLIGELCVISDAHDLLQPSGCGCSDHITYPTDPNRATATTAEVTA